MKIKKTIEHYIFWVDKINRKVGRATMYLVFVMIGVLIYASISKQFSTIPRWTLEMSQFLMVSYFILGGPYSMQLGEHVRMDLLYANWSESTQRKMECITIFFLIIYLIIMLYGSISSTAYSIDFNERTRSLWNPYLWPIKVVVTFGFVLMLLQSIAIFFKSIFNLQNTSTQEKS